MGNRDWALHVFAAASYLEARGANPYRVRAYRRAGLRLLRMEDDASAYLDAHGELNVPGLGDRLRRKLGELVRTGRMSFHDELIAAEPRPIRTLMQVPGIGPRTADRLVGELHIRGLKGLASAARRGRLRRLRGSGWLANAPGARRPSRCWRRSGNDLARSRGQSGQRDGAARPADDERRSIAASDAVSVN